MRFSRHASTILLGLGIIAGAGSSCAWSEEQLVMPFACDARGGGVRLTPAPEQSYRIFGVREKWLFRYCSPNAPDRCHHWMLHQFDVDCGGIRVPWIRVAEASAQDGRAWVEDGRMTLGLGAAEAGPREERYPRRGWWRHRGAYPADERERFDGPSGPHSEMVELPAGFAPVLGTRAQFVGAPPAEMSSEPVERSSEFAAAPTKPAQPATQKREALPSSAQPKDATAPAIKPPAPAPAKREPARASEQVQASEQSTQKPEKAAAPPAKIETAATAAPKAVEAPSGTSVTPTIINRPKDPSAPPAENSAAAADPPITGKSGAAGAAQAPASASETPAPAAAAAQSQTQIAAASEQEKPAAHAPSPIATGSLRDSATNAEPLGLLQTRTLTIGFVLFGVLAASSFVLWSRRQERARLSTIVQRDFASVSFGGEALSARLLAPLDPRPPPAHTEGTQTALAETGFEMPSTPAEARQLLGASPDAATDVIKKIVDGLRQSWHPDLATSDDDRRHREQRIKQINVAWDILSGRRSAA
jgi:hypothetical protein